MFSDPFFLSKVFAYILNWLPLLLLVGFVAYAFRRSGCYAKGAGERRDNILTAWKQQNASLEQHLAKIEERLKKLEERSK